MNKRYQVFISSTYLDLIEEREIVIKTLLELNFFPAGMEIFPATDDDQFKYIKKIIDDSDYYLLIISGKYGSIGKKGISYTEMEFDYALKAKKPIVAFLYKDIESLIATKIEKDINKKQLLDNFIKKLKYNRLIKYWENKNDLATKVSIAITKLIESHPSNGWYRLEKSDIIQNTTYDPLYVPSRIFEASSSSSLEFNRDLTHELRRSRTFFFRGISGKRCSIRIKHLKNNPHDLQIKLIIPHPYRDITFLMDRISHRMITKGFYEFDNELELIQNDIPLSIISLWNHRFYFHSCEIVFQKDSSISRLEIFDHAAYISLYDSELTEKKYHPPIIKFSDTSIFYEVYRREAYREHEISGLEGNKILINKNYSKQDLKNDFLRLELGELTDDKIAIYLNAYNDFEKEFLKESEIDK